MRILMIAGEPLFPDHVRSGSQRILREIALFLGFKNHEVTILCTEHPGLADVFTLAPSVTVSPTIRLGGSPSNRGAALPHALCDAVLQVRQRLAFSDVLYLHDAGFLYHLLRHELPTVVSFRNLVYSDTVAGAIAFRRDSLILNSDYLAGCVHDAFAAFLPDIRSRIQIIPNGINLDHFSSSCSHPLPQILADLPGDTIRLLYPHRPDPRKGIYESLKVVQRIILALGSSGSRVRLLMPDWAGSDQHGAISSHSQSFYQAALGEAERLGISSSIVLHPWIPYASMPAYYALGHVTLCLGNFVESFGNVVVESLACGTPPVVANVGAFRGAHPADLVRSVEQGDIDSAVAAVLEALITPVDIGQARAYLAGNFSHESMLASYERVLTTARLSPSLREDYLSGLDESTTFSIPTWCFLKPGVGVYHDYEYRWFADPEILALLERITVPMSLGAIVAAGGTLSAVESALQKGLLVPVPSAWQQPTRHREIGGA